MKAQIEIMGLAVIIVLIVLGLLVFVSLTGSEEQPGTVKRQQDELSTTFVSTLLRTHIPECDQDLSDVIRDCANQNRICEHANTCEIAETVIEDLANETLGERGTAYLLTVEYPSRNWSTSAQNCSVHKDTSPAPVFPITLYPRPGTVDVRLLICK